MPVIVAGEYGKGRSLAVTTDTLWRWGFVAAARPGDDGRQYTKLWENAIRWLIQDPDLRNLHVDSDAVEYVPGAPVRVTVRLLGRDYQPLPNGEVVARRQARRRPGEGRAGRSRRRSRSARTARRRYELGGLTPGVYRVEGHADDRRPPGRRERHLPRPRGRHRARSPGRRPGHARGDREGDRRHARSARSTSCPRDLDVRSAADRARRPPHRCRAVEPPRPAHPGRRAPRARVALAPAQRLPIDRGTQHVCSSTASSPT